MRICDAKFGNIHRWDGQGFQLVATFNLPAAFAKARNRLPFVRPTPDNVFGRMVATKTVIHVADLASDDAYIGRNPATVAAVELGGVRTMLFVPMLKDNEMIGAFTLYRQEVRPFTDKQIALVQNFAAKPSSPSRTRGCSTNCASAPTDLSRVAATADRDRRRAEGHQPLDFDLQTVLETLVEIGCSPLRCRQGHHYPTRMVSCSIGRRPMASRPNS